MPFARYVLEHAGHLEFPFRRYQIQPAWRGERPQEGRYRQFNQADVDIVGRDELPFHHDVEVMRVMVDALDALPLPPLSFQFNNRKLIQGFYRGPRPARRDGGDPHDRQARQAAGRRRSPSCSCRDAGATPEQAERCLELATIRVPDTSFVERSARWASRTSCSTRGSPSSRPSSRAARRRERQRVTVEANLRIARGLDYYTGTVVEIFMAGYERLKSVGGGGRYDALASDGKTTYPGVGVSFGVSRTLIPLLADGVLAGSRPVPSAVLVAAGRRGVARATARPSRPRCAPAGSRARSRRRAQKFGKQIRYAERRGIPFVWFPGRRSTRSRTSAAATRWSPTRRRGNPPSTTCARR